GRPGRALGGAGRRPRGRVRVPTAGDLARAQSGFSSALGFCQERLRICRGRTDDHPLVHSQRSADRDEFHARPGRRHGFLSKREKQRRGAEVSGRVLPLDEPRHAYSQITTGLPVITPRSMENMIQSDRVLATANVNGADVLDLSFLKQLEEERKNKK